MGMDMGKLRRGLVFDVLPNSGNVFFLESMLLSNLEDVCNLLFHIPLSSTLAEITMQHLEIIVLPHFMNFFQIFWFRYVDDIFILSNASLDSIQTILDRM